MRPGPPSSVLAGNIDRSVRVASWHGAELLAADVPVDSGTFEEAAQEIPEKITIVVPVRGRGGPWAPGEDPTHPLARFGQRLNVVIDTRSSRGLTWETPLGWFQIQDWDLNDDETAVTVVATGLLQVVADDTLPRPEQPAAGGTFVSEVRRLMTGGIPVEIHEDLVNRSVPGSHQWEEDRLSALYDLADAWPARILTGSDGVVRFRPPLGDSPVPVAELSDGENGVLISAPRGDSRDGVFTAVVASSSADDPNSTPVSAEYITPSGIYAPASYGLVRRRYASPLLATPAACLSAAKKIAQDSQRQGRTQTITLPPDPRLQRGDVIRYLWDGAVRTGWIQETRLPLTVDGAAMSLTIGLPS